MLEHGEVLMVGSRRLPDAAHVRRRPNYQGIGWQPMSNSLMGVR
jgi:hypothetical protein